MAASAAVPPFSNISIPTSIAIGFEELTPYDCSVFLSIGSFVSEIGGVFEHPAKYMSTQSEMNIFPVKRLIIDYSPFSLSFQVVSLFT
jgi:hypothetical protein